MSIDLRKDFTVICKHVKKRVREYPVYENLGPGRDEDPISMITLGFDFDQSCWISLVFDTRPNASPDGEWNNYISENEVEFDHWFERPGIITLHDSSTARIDEPFDEVVVGKYFGDMLRGVLISSRDNGVFAKLPVTDDCILCTEHFGGAYGAIEYVDGREPEKTDEEREAALRDRIGKRPIDEQVKYWIAILNRMFSGNTTELHDQFLFVDKVIFRALASIGAPAVLPLLRLCYKWARHPEFEGDRPKRNIQDTPVGDLGWQALGVIESVGDASAPVRQQLVRIINRAAAVNARRNLWGTIPWHAARTLHNLCGYPVPKTNPRTNALINLDDYAK